MITNLALPLFLNLLPDHVHCRALTFAFNQICRGQDISYRLKDLENLRIDLTITDTNTRLRFRIVNHHFIFDTSRQEADVRIKASIENYFRLLKKQEDPDTLFFSRDISIEGNTEDSLMLKNLIDAFEFDREKHLGSVVGKPLAKKLVNILNVIH